MNLTEIKKREIKTNLKEGEKIKITLFCRFAKMPGDFAPNPKFVLIWFEFKGKKYWFLFAKGKTKKNFPHYLCRGIGNKKIDFWIYDREIFSQIQLFAKCFFDNWQREQIKIWRKIYAGKKIAHKPNKKFWHGFTLKKPEPDFFTNQENVVDLERALNHPSGAGRKKDYGLHLKKQSKIKPHRNSNKHDLLEEFGQVELNLWTDNVD